MLLYGELSILQDSNMVKRKSRLQTNLKFDTLLRLNKPMSYGNWFGSENYSGK